MEHSPHSKHWRYAIKGPYATGRESYATRERAGRAVDRLDNQYGAYRHMVVKPTYEPHCPACDALRTERAAWLLPQDRGAL